MKKKILIFGNGDFAQIAFLYFSQESNFEVVAFVLDEEYLDSKNFCGLPVISVETALKVFPPERFGIFIALGYSKVNQVRKDKFIEFKRYGYELVSFVSAKALVLQEVEIGENCFIFEGNTLQPFVTIGDNVTIWSGNHLGHHSKIGSHTFISSHVVISGRVEIGEQCFFGVNATIRDHIKIGDRCVIGAGTLLLKNAPNESVFIGNPSTRSDILSSKLRNI